MEAANQAAAAPKTEQVAGNEQSVEVEQGGASAIFRSLALGGGSGGNKPKPTVTPSNILQLQRMVGNQSVQRLIQRQMAQKAVARVITPITPQAPIVARDDYNNVGDEPVFEEEEVFEAEEEAPEDDYNNGAEVQQQVVQVTDLDVLDNVDDNAPLPESANEIEGQQPEAQAPEPVQEAPQGGFQQANTTRPAPKRHAGMMGGHRPQTFDKARVPNKPQGGQLGGQRVAPEAYDPNAPKTFTDAAPLHDDEKGEQIGQGEGNQRRKDRLIRTNLKVRTRYLNKVERRAYRISIEGGVFKNAKGQPLDSSGAQGFSKGTLGGLIFVMSQRGKMYAADMVAEYNAGGYDAATQTVKPGTREVIAFHHSSFKAGKAVAGAGEIVVKGGKLEKLNDGSGHYRPREGQTLQVLIHFQNLGVDLTQVRFKTAKDGYRDIADGVLASDYLATGGDYTLAYQNERQRLNGNQPQQPPQQPQMPVAQQQAPQSQQSQAEEEPTEYNA